MGRNVAKIAILECFFMPVVLGLAIANAKLHPEDLAALQSVRRSLRDMPGSSFFSTWNFNQDPCLSFSGVVCSRIQGEDRVTALSLGSGYAGDPGLAGELSPSLGSLPFLNQLTAGPAAVAGGIPSTLGHLSHLQFLGISHNRLSGAIPRTFSDLTSLRVLDLSKNMLSGSIPEELGALPSLIAVTLSDNSLSGAVPSFRSGIVHMDLGQNRLSGSLPALPPSLTYISLKQNSFGGGLLALAPLQSLRYVDLSFNEFTGGVPIKLLQGELDSLLVQHNRLSGAISPGMPVHIKAMDFSDNRISGPLSPFLATAQELYLNNNILSGTVPLEFLDSLLSGSMMILYLQHNYLTGFEVHSGFALPRLSSVCLQYNCMIPLAQSTCPLRSGKQGSRPSSQCKNIHS